MLLAFLVGPIWAWHSYRGVDERPQGFHADQAWLSGPLSSAHANLKGDCQSCHVEPFVAVTDRACVGCHTGEPKAMSQAHADATPAMLLAARAPPGVGGRSEEQTSERQSLMRNSYAGFCWKQERVTKKRVR